MSGRKIALFCNVRQSAVIQALDVASIYDVPGGLSRGRARPRGAGRLRHQEAPEPDLELWSKIVDTHRPPRRRGAVAVVGKYTVLQGRLQIAHGGAGPWRHRQGRARSISMARRARCSRRATPSAHLEDMHGIIVPGGFGERGAEGKIEAARYARERKVPYLGICFGMQMAVIEVARHVAGIDGRELDRVRPRRRARRRPDDRMDERRRSSSTADARAI